MTNNEAKLSDEGHLATNFSLGTVNHYLVLSLIVLVLIIAKKRLSLKDKDNGTNGRRKKGLEAVPGPRPFPLLGNLLDVVPVNRLSETAVKWGKNYGQIFKLEAPLNHPVVFLNSGPLAQTLLKSSDPGHVTKMPLIYDLMKPYITNGVNVSKGKFWQHQRKILIRSQTYQSIRAFIPSLNNHCERLVDSLDKLFADGGVHTINSVLCTLFLGIVSELITGVDFHDTGECSEYHHNSKIWGSISAHRLTHPWNLLGPIFSFNPLSKKYDAAVKHMSDFARQRIKEHKKRRDDAAPKTLEPRFRSVLDDLVDAEVPDDQIQDEVNTMMFGGSDTSSVVLHHFCLAMGLYPEIQETCRKEVDEVFQDPMQVRDGRITYDSLTQLKGVERGLLETMRLYPPSFFYARELESPLIIELNNEPVELPVGTNVAVCPFILHRQEEVYPDPERFDPDRFLPEEVAGRHAYAYAPFSHGPRNCLGLKFAMIEMKMVAAYLLRNFVIGTRDKVGDVRLLPNFTLTPE